MTRRSHVRLPLGLVPALAACAALAGPPARAAGELPPERPTTPYRAKVRNTYSIVEAGGGRSGGDTLEIRVSGPRLFEDPQIMEEKTVIVDTEKREVLEFRRATAPLLMPLNQLAVQPIAVVRPEVREYFRDVYDHLLRVNEQVEAFRDLLTSILEANLTQMNIRQNEDMRRISAWVAIAVVPTMIAGIYGMNFEYMPELRSPVGYPMVLLGMLVICTGMYVFFKKQDWL